MLTPNTVKQRAAKIWQRGDLHHAYLEKSSVFPLSIALPSLTAKRLLNEYSEVQQSIRLLRRDSEQQGYKIHYKAIQHRQLGEQKIPYTLEFSQQQDFLAYLGKKTEFKQFQSLVEQTLVQHRCFFTWLVRYPFKLMQYADVWRQLLSVCDYFLAHPQPDCYLRELDIPLIDSKFIEQHKAILNELLPQILPDSSYHVEITGLQHAGFERRYGLRYEQPLVRLRILDSRLAIHGLTDISLPLQAFKQLDIAAKTVFIVENKISLLTFPQYTDALVIFGSGYAVNLLQQARCLQDRKLYYWGDLDADGFAILAQARQYYPQIHSLMMDRETLVHCTDLMGEDSSGSELKTLSSLNSEEQQLYQQLQQSSLRLEQERIPFSYVEQCLAELKQ